MAKCALCGADTVLHVNDVPICTRCDDQGNTPKKPAERADRDTDAPKKDTAAS